MSMDYMLLVDTAVLAGEIMLGSGAEAYRVEDTISHFLNTAKLKHAQVFVTTTGIIATLSDPSIEAITVVRRVQKRSTNLNKIYLVNDLCVHGLCDTRCAGTYFFTESGRLCD